MRAEFQGGGGTRASGPSARRRFPSRFALAVAAPGPALWALTLAIMGVDAVWIAVADIRLEPFGVVATATAVALLLALSAFWGAAKPEPTLRGMALASAFLLAFTAAAAVLHDLTATLAFPLVDAQLAAAETALGFDWRAYHAFLEAHPALARALALAYHSSGPQVGLVVIALSAVRRLGRLWLYARLFATTLLFVIAVSSVFPAEGPYAFYNMPEVGAAAPQLESVGGTWHLAGLAELRSGAPITLALGDIRGLVTFPSFHVCLAMLTAWALAPVPVLGALAVLLNLAVIVATVGSGGHYFPDLVAGALVAAAALAPGALRRARQRFRHGKAGTLAGSLRSWRTRSAVMRAPS